MVSYEKKCDVHCCLFQKKKTENYKKKTPPQPDSWPQSQSFVSLKQYFGQKKIVCEINVSLSYSVTYTR